MKTITTKTSYELTDPFTGKTVTIERDLLDRLRGKYAVGPRGENGEPEFGYREFEATAINLEAANKIEELMRLLNEIPNSI